MNTVWVLGASDPEMTAIEKLLRECGQQVQYAVVAGARAQQGNANKADAIALADGSQYITVECSCEGLTAHMRIDHRAPGDFGFERPPSMAASAIGQVITELARLEMLPLAWTYEDCDVPYSDVAVIVLYQPTHLGVPDGPEVWLVRTHEGYPFSCGYECCGTEDYGIRRIPPEFVFGE